MINQAQHIIPVGGEEPLHFASAACWCQPLHKDGLVMHNAKDCREKLERQGVGTGLQWVRVLGIIDDQSFMIERLRKAYADAKKKQEAAERALMEATNE